MADTAEDEEPEELGFCPDSCTENWVTWGKSTSMSLTLLIYKLEEDHGLVTEVLWQGLEYCGCSVNHSVQKRHES